MNIFFDVPGSALPEQNSVEFTKNIEFYQVVPSDDSYI